jgi:selenoprotein W-related protein
MKQEFGANVDMIPSGGGVFEVVVDGRLIYSKKATGEFPDEAVLLESVKV